MDLRDALQRIALEMPSYGQPRITAELRRRGWKVNPKRIYRLMREDNLLCVRRRKFVVTTESNHGPIAEVRAPGMRRSAIFSTSAKPPGKRASSATRFSEGGRKSVANGSENSRMRLDRFDSSARNRAMYSGRLAGIVRRHKIERLFYFMTRYMFCH
jgi:transposase InsO family protein